ncbi:MAG: signal recognition particle protein [Candidatus Aenigmarchaeota archaeon]|nr:signal recognition particle protein [Candidatus Aenigmarchaeota archaeon]
MPTSLGKSLSNLMKRILFSKRLDKKEVESFIKELQRVLLQADVSVELVKKISDNLRKKCLETKPPPGLTLREHLIKTLYEELVELLGKEPSSLIGKRRIMLIGLFGSGKTTTAGKLAKYLQKQGLKPALVACDYHRPAAPDQLKQIGEQIGIPVHVNKDKDPFKAAKEGMEKFKQMDSIIFDTAGRNALDKELADELKKLGRIINPDEVLLVIPADIGKVGGKQAEEFNKLVGITGVVITKMDGTARGGGALAACAATGAKVKFLGTGERLDDLEVYDPIRFVSRLIGFGDLQALMEKAREAEIKEEDVKKIVEGSFTLADFYKQIEAMQKMGPLDQLAQMIPGLGYTLPQDILQIQEEKMKKWKAIIQSMTPEERENPSIINKSRIERIAKGSGTKESEVRELLRQFEKMKKLIKSMGGIKGLKRGAFQKVLKRFGFKM